MKNNIIIAFEGLDCSFKETNYNSFLSHLRGINNAMNLTSSIHAESFPRYGHWACKCVEKWLNGTFDRDMLRSHPKAVDSFYSIDRFEYWYGANKDGNRRIDLLNDSSKFHYFIFDRYNLSNSIYNPIHPNEVHIEDFTFDNDIYGIPNPDIVVWMRMNNFDILSNLIAQKKNRDKNELDIEFIRNAWERSEDIIKSNIFDKLGIKLVITECLNEDGTIKSRDDIASFIWDSVCKIM